METVFITSGDGPPDCRDSYWLDQRQHLPYPLLETRLPGDRKQFHADLAVRRIGSASLARCHSSRMTLSRSAETISEARCGGLVLLRLERGAYEHRFDGLAMATAPQVGDFLLFDGDVPSVMDVADQTTATYLLIPHRVFRPYLADVAGLRPRLVPRGAPLYPMLARCFDAYLALRDPDVGVADAALSVLAHLATTALDHGAVDEAGMARSLAEARRSRALEFARQRLEDPQLNPRMIATHLGLSQRSLHALFEPTGEGVAARIARMRAERARDFLTRFPERTTLDIGLACGFDSVATFYRSFTKVYGVPPGQIKRNGLG